MGFAFYVLQQCSNPFISSHSALDGGKSPYEKKIYKPSIDVELGLIYIVRPHLYCPRRHCHPGRSTDCLMSNGWQWD